ncbi:unnamed protein product [Trifolium pratense]|uniref:Uncharacterized protein n=1 Tax=Trifolium pratense TaxID=57577 RepID=A0ACB0IDX6_TRIPR|nr:unnamed protein product [Trifolium pratense]
MEDMSNFLSPSAAMEEQLRALQLQHLQNNQVSQQGYFIHQPPYNTPVQRNLHQQYGFINNAPTMDEINSAMGGLCVNYSIGDGYGRLPGYEDYRMRERAFVEARTALRMCRHRRSIVSLAMDPHECDYLQMMIEEGSPTHVEVILSGVKDYLHLLMTHPFGNNLIRKIFEARRGITWEQVNYIINLIISNDRKLRRVCMDKHGTQVMQIMLENIICPITKYKVVNTMKRITVPLMKNVNGNHVIVQCVKLFPPELQSIILNEVARNCVDIATNKTGTKVIQKCLREGDIIATALLVTEIISSAMVLAEDPYGNYVLQVAIKLKFPSANERIIKELGGKFVRLSMNKYASNVVEDLLRVSNQNDVQVIVEEIMRSHNFLNVLQDSFGNYVVQRALQYIQGRLRKELSNLINSYHKELHSHHHGKNVLTMAKTYIEGEKVQCLRDC